MAALKEVNLTQLIVDQRKNNEEEEEEGIDEAMFDTHEELSADFFPLFSIAPPSCGHSRSREHSPQADDGHSANTPTAAAENEQEQDKDVQGDAVDTHTSTSAAHAQREDSDSGSHGRSASRSCSQRHMRTQGQHRVQPTPYKIRSCDDDDEEDEQVENVDKDEEDDDGSVEWHIVDDDDEAAVEEEDNEESEKAVQERGTKCDAALLPVTKDMTHDEQPQAVAPSVQDKDHKDADAPTAAPPAAPLADQTRRPGKLSETKACQLPRPPWLSVEELRQLCEDHTRLRLHNDRYGRFLHAYLGVPEAELVRACRRARVTSAIGVHKVKGSRHEVLVKTTQSFRRHSVLAVEGDAVFVELITRAERLEARRRQEAAQQLQACMPPALCAQLMHNATDQSGVQHQPMVTVGTNARCIALHYGLPAEADKAQRFPRATLLAVVCSTRLEEGTEIRVSLESYYRCLDEPTWYARCQAEPAVACASPSDTRPTHKKNKERRRKDEVTRVCWGVREFARWPHGLPYYHGVGHRHESGVAQAGFPFTLVDLVPTPELGPQEKGLATTHPVPYATCFLYGGPAVTTAQIERVLLAQQQQQQQQQCKKKKEGQGSTACRTRTPFPSSRRGRGRFCQHDDHNDDDDEEAAVQHERKQHTLSKPHTSPTAVAAAAAARELHDMSFVLDDTYALGLGKHEVCYGQGLARYINHRYNLSAFGNCELCSLMIAVPPPAQTPPRQPSSPASPSSVHSYSTVTSAQNEYSTASSNRPYRSYPRRKARPRKGCKAQLCNTWQAACHAPAGQGREQEDHKTRDKLPHHRLSRRLATRQAAKRRRAKRAGATAAASHGNTNHSVVHDADLVSDRMQDVLMASTYHDNRRPAAVAALRSFQALQQHHHHHHSHNSHLDADGDAPDSEQAVSSREEKGRREAGARVVHSSARRHNGCGRKRRTTAAASSSSASSPTAASPLPSSSSLPLARRTTVFLPDSFANSHNNHFVLITLPFFITTTDIPAGVAMLAWTYGEEYDAKLERMVVADGQLVPAIDAAVLNASRPLLLSRSVPCAATCWVRYRTAQEVHRGSFVRRWQRYQGDYRFAIAVGDVVWRRRPYCVAHAPYIDYSTQSDPYVKYEAAATDESHCKNKSVSCSDDDGGGEAQEEEAAPVWLAYDTTLAHIPRRVAAKMAIRVLCSAPEEDLFVVVAVMRHQAERVLLRPVSWIALSEATVRDVVRENGLEDNSSSTKSYTSHSSAETYCTTATTHRGCSAHNAGQRAALPMCTVESENRADRMLGKRICAARRRERAACLPPRWAVCELADPSPYHRFHRSAAAGKAQPSSSARRQPPTTPGHVPPSEHASPTTASKRSGAAGKLASAGEPQAEVLLRGCIVATTDSVALLLSGTDYHHVSLDSAALPGAADKSRRSFIAVDREELRRHTQLVRQSAAMAQVPPLCSGLLWPLFCAQPAPTLAALTLAATRPAL